MAEGLERLAYEGTDGDLTFEPDIEIIQQFLIMDSDYWLGGSGSAYIGTIREMNPGYSIRWDRPCLHIIVHPPYGISLMLQIGNGAKMTVDTSVPDDQLVLHYLGGEPAAFPRQCFISMESAKVAIADFLEFGSHSTSVEWRQRASAVYDGYRIANSD